MTEIREILFPSDLSAESDQAFEHARVLAETFRARLTLYHALEMPGEQYAGWVDMNEDRRGQWAAKVRQELARRAQALTVGHEVVVQEDHVGGRPLADLAVLAFIRKTRPDLTVMATRRRPGFASFFLGSVTGQVVQHAGRPILCVRKAPHGDGLPYRRLLVTTDLSPASRHAFGIAALLARRFEAAVTAVHIRPRPTLGSLMGAPLEPAPPPSEDEVRRFLQPEFEGLPVTARVGGPGAAWDGIVKAAAEDRSDLIVMSTQGHDSVRDGILGSNTERVLRHAPCAVLVA